MKEMEPPSFMDGTRGLTMKVGYLTVAQPLGNNALQRKKFRGASYSPLTSFVIWS